MELSELFTIRDLIQSCSEAGGVPVEIGQNERSDRESVLLLYSGKGSFRGPKGEQKLSPGVAVMIRSKQPWLLSLGEGSGVWEIAYQWEFLSDLMFPDYRNRHDGVIPVEADIFRDMTGLAQMMEAEQKRDVPNARYLRFLLAALLELLHVQRYPMEGEGYFGSPTDVREFQRLLAIVESQYAEQHQVGFYAKKLGMSSKRLNALCKSVVGKSVRVLLEDRRMREAKNLLISTQLSVAEIAESIGYMDQAYFSRVFRKKYEMTPSAYREGNLPLKIQRNK